METYLIPCLLGLEKLVGDEIRRLGLRDVQVENGRVLCRGQLSDIARLNINLRCGARVLMELGSFPARAEELAAQGKAVILISSELPEVLGMSDRVLVVKDDAIVAELVENVA